MTQFGFDSTNGLIVVGTRLWGPLGEFDVRLALDTGATITMVNAQILVSLGYDPALVTDRVRITTASGVEYAARLPISRIEALGRRRDEFQVLCYTLPPSTTVDGLLGLDFFRETSLRIDFRERFVELS